MSTKPLNPPSLTSEQQQILDLQEQIAQMQMDIPLAQAARQIGNHLGMHFHEAWCDESLADQVIARLAARNQTPAPLSFALVGDTQNPKGFSVVVERMGDGAGTDQPIYDELSISILRNGEPVGSIQVGLTVDAAEPRVLLTTDGNDQENTLCIYPMRESDEAVEYNGPVGNIKHKP